MKLRYFFLFWIAIIAIQLFAETRNQNDGSSIILTKTGNVRPHLIGDVEPTASVVVYRNATLNVNLDVKNFHHYAINLFSSDGSVDTTFTATSATLSLPITSNTLDYLVTIDGGDYGTYDGVFNTRGDSVTITDAIALKLVKNRRENNNDAHYYSATVNKLINDNRCWRG